MEKYIADFIKTKEVLGFSAMHIKSYLYSTQRFCKLIEKPSDIKEKVISDYFYSIQQSKYSSSTKFKMMYSVKEFCLYLKSINKLILNDKCLQYSVRKTDSISKEIWSEKEIELLIGSIEDGRLKRLKAIVELAYSCGLRLKEIIKADLYDLNLTEQTLLIKESKGKDRLLPVNKKAIQAVQEYLIARQKIKLKTTALFVTNTGERMKSDNIHQTLKKLRIRKKIGKKLTIHVIRNSIATHLLRRQMNFALISKFLGHSRISTTTIYTRVVKTDLVRMIDQFHPRDSFEID